MMGSVAASTYSRDGGATKGCQAKQFFRIQFVTVVPETIEVGTAPAQEGRDAARQRVALPSAALEAALQIHHHGGLAVADHVLCALLHNGHAAQRLGERLHLGRGLLAVPGLLSALNLETLPQPAELNDIGRQDNLFPAHKKLGVAADDGQRIGIQHHGHLLLAGRSEHLGTRLLHERVPAQTWADHEDVQPTEHLNDLSGDLIGVRVGRRRRAAAGRVRGRLAHQRVHHQVGRVSLDNGAGAGCADDVRLFGRCTGSVIRLLGPASHGEYRLSRRPYHIAAQSGTGHGREVRSARIVLAAANDGHSALLA